MIAVCGKELAITKSALERNITEKRQMLDEIDALNKQIADLEAKAKNPEPQPEHRCLKCKRFVKKGVTYCDKCFDKVAGIKAEVTR